MAGMSELRQSLDGLNLSFANSSSVTSSSLSYSQGSESHGTAGSGGSGQQSRCSGQRSRCSSQSKGGHDCNSGYINDFTDIEISTSQGGHRRDSIAETVDTNMSVPEDYAFTDRYNKLVDLERVPWTERDVLNVLREGRTKDIANQISMDLVQRLSYLLQRPLVRICREAHRLSITFGKCTKHEIQTAMKAILARSLSESCFNACLKAVALCAMSGDSFKQSKSSRCGLHFSVGHFHRWMIDAHVSLRIHELAAIYLTACLENLVEEIVLLALSRDQTDSAVAVTVENFEYGIANSPELWGVLQPFEHLICGRNSSGNLTLPSSLNLHSSKGTENHGKVRARRHDKMNGSMMKNLEQSLLATCVGSVAEIGDLVSRAMHQWYNRPVSQTSSPNSKHHPLTWGPGGLHALFYYMKCSQLEHADNPNITPPLVHLTYDRPYAVLPPLIEWIRVTTAYTEHRHSWVVDGDDVRQAARVLLPGVDCPPRQFGNDDESFCTARHLDAQTCAQKFQQDVAFRMLACGRSDMLPQALLLLGPDKINTINQQGLTPLMYACMRGDEAMVQMLVDSGAKLNVAVPADISRYPCVHPETKYWTALTFAAVHGHISVVQLLLEHGANVEGSIESGDDNYTETPLQLGAAAGHYELVSLLLAKNADPYLSTVQKNGISFGTSSSGNFNSFALAAANGHRNVLRKLLSHPIVSKTSDILSLEEILAEGTTETVRRKYDPDSNKNGNLKVRGKISQDLYMSMGDVEKRGGGGGGGGNDNEYVTFQEMMTQDNKLHIKQQPLPPRPTTPAGLNKSQIKSLQEALYHAAENGYLDVAMELRNLGVPWTLHSWAQCLTTAYNVNRRATLQCLLKDFSEMWQDDYRSNFMEECLPHMVDIFRNSKNEATSQQLASIFSRLYASNAIPAIEELQKPSFARIDPEYINNPELSDVQFLIEGKLFYAHKLILVTASKRFKAMLSSKFCEGSQPCIEINDIRFHTFELIMTYLYNGGVGRLEVGGTDLIELMGAANFFLLEGLQRHCEVLCSQKLNFDNCVSIYRHAKLFNAVELMAFCEGFFLQNLTKLLTNSESFKKLVYNTKAQNYDILNGLLATLTQRLEERMQNRRMVTPAPTPIPR